MMEEQKFKGLSGSALKYIAVISMLIDHTAAVLLQHGAWALQSPTHPQYFGYLVLRCIGRPAFPIFCFLIAEGYVHTRSRWKYLFRLALFGLIAELPFDLALNGAMLEFRYQNVFFTLALGLLAVILWDILYSDGRWWSKPLAILALLSCAAAAELMHTDYGGLGVATVFLMYLLREREWPRNLATAAALTAASVLEVFSIPDWALFHFYNGERGRQPKYFFYVFYPAHLLILSGLRYLIFKI